MGTATRLALAIVFLTGSMVFGQDQPIQSYNWRSQNAVSTGGRTQSVKREQKQARPYRQAKMAPQAPVMKRSPFLVSFRNKQEGTKSVINPNLADGQSSVSDVGQYKFETPAAPQVQGDMVYGSQGEPGLSVNSNATPEAVSPYCNQPAKSWCNLGCEKKLFGKSCSGLEIGGWLNFGYHNRDTPLVNNRSDQVAVHQLWGFVNKSARQDTGGWDIGYRLDYLYGIDAQDLQAFGNAPTGAPIGWDNGWDRGSYGWALPQLYVQFANCNWDIKAGKFFSPFGYEVIGATGNFFYSHSYTMYNSEPFTMTGVLGERRISDNRSVILGVTAGWDTGFESNSGGNLITGVRFQPNQYVDVAVTTSIGDTGFRDSGRLTSAVAQMQLTSDISYVLQADSLDLGTNQEFGIIQYLFKDVTDCLKLGGRLEWWKSDQFFTSTRSTYSFTMGANYRANANITVRPEVRWDWGAGAVDPGASIVGIDAVMTF